MRQKMMAYNNKGVFQKIVSNFYFLYFYNMKKQIIVKMLKPKETKSEKREEKRDEKMEMKIMK
jgi:hypothetical protein